MKEFPHSGQSDALHVPVVAGGALFCDFYELTMAASYLELGLEGVATFDLFVRSMPPRRTFLVACGTEDAADYLASFRYESSDIEYLASLGVFPDRFLRWLESVRFTGDVWAIPEGEVFFAAEPVFRVTAPLPEAQIVETALLSLVSFHTTVATKAARVQLACAGRAFVDFSARRDHGPGAALGAAKAAYVGGASATSNLEAARAFGIPPSGTMAHSYVMRLGDERVAFRAFGRMYRERAVLLIDTWDTLRGARIAAEVARELEDEGVRIAGVRLDSGDLVRLSAAVRGILDEAGLERLKIFASGDLDEYRIAEVVASGAPVDAFGVGTRLGTSADSPALGAVYKLMEDEEGPRMKLSEGKETLPGRKQVWRYERDGTLAYDVLGLADEDHPEGRALLQPLVVGGERVRPRPNLDEARERCSRALAALPERLRDLHAEGDLADVRISEPLRELRERCSRRLRDAPDPSRLSP
ncbi:MAG: nicotinate phosphoribosyltransferase [Acidimicrobiales bacterium]|nr:MAG: nicotinate phosphoribosyltransferase [Acidimicrobiales bacterium]